MHSHEIGDKEKRLWEVRELLNRLLTRMTPEGRFHALGISTDVESVPFLLHTIADNLSPGVHIVEDERLMFASLWDRFGAEEVYGPLMLPEAPPVPDPPMVRTVELGLDMKVSVTPSFICVCEHDSCYINKGSDLHLKICECPKDHQILAVTIEFVGNEETCETVYVTPDQSEQLVTEFRATMEQVLRDSELEKAIADVIAEVRKPRDQI